MPLYHSPPDLTPYPPNPPSPRLSLNNLHIIHHLNTTTNCYNHEYNANRTFLRIPFVQTQKNKNKGQEKNSTGANAPPLRAMAQERFRGKYRGKEGFSGRWSSSRTATFDLKVSRSKIRRVRQRQQPKLFWQLFDWISTGLGD